MEGRDEKARDTRRVERKGQAGPGKTGQYRRAQSMNDDDGSGKG